MVRQPDEDTLARKLFPLLVRIFGTALINCGEVSSRKIDSTLLPCSWWLEKRAVSFAELSQLYILKFTDHVTGSDCS